MRTTPLQDISNPIARQIVEGKPPEDVVRELVRRGWRDDIARNYVDRLNRKYDLEHGEHAAGSMLRTLLLRVFYTALLTIFAGGICAIGLSLPFSVVGLILFAVGVVAFSLGMVFILLK